MSDPTLAGKTFVITGANTGIGRANALALAARKPDRIVIAARSRERTAPVIEAVRSLNPDGAVDFVPLDLTSLAAVREAADRILELDRPIDVLINNAGVAGVRGQTADGFELAWGTNHVGHSCSPRSSCRCWSARRRAGWSSSPAAGTTGRRASTGTRSAGRRPR